MEMKILTVDDSKVMRRIISGTIEALGYAVLTAQHGKDALQVLDAHPNQVSLILLDWNMPVMDGFATLKALKADERYRDIPVMMVTTESEPENVVAALQAGAKHYLSKPFSQQDLAVRIMEAMGLA